MSSESPWRDAVLALIWPIAIIVGGVVFCVWIWRAYPPPSPRADAAPERIPPSTRQTSAETHSVRAPAGVGRRGVADSPAKEAAGHIAPTPPQTSTELAATDEDQPPATWTGSHWMGKQIIRCPFGDNYRTNSDQRFQEHFQTHTDPPDKEHAHRVFDQPQPWAKVPIHFIGDGSAYVPDVPADPSRTLYATRERADEIIAYGLYLEGPAPATKPDKIRPPVLAGVPPEHRAQALQEYEVARTDLIARGRDRVAELWRMSVEDVSRANAENVARTPTNQWENLIAEFRQQWWPGDESLERDFLDAPGDGLPALGPLWRSDLARRIQNGVLWLESKHVP